MAHRGLGLGVEQLGVYGVPRQRLQGHRCNKLARSGRHNDADVGTQLLQLADQLCAFIGGNTAGNAEQNLFVNQRSHIDPVKVCPER